MLDYWPATGPLPPKGSTVPPSNRSGLLMIGLVLALLLATGCASVSTPSQPEPMPASAVLSEPVPPSWRDYSQRVADYLKRARESLEKLFP